MARCDLAPEGWQCTREPGHAPPCAAEPEGERYALRSERTTAQLLGPAAFVVTLVLALGFALGLALARATEEDPYVKLRTAVCIQLAEETDSLGQADRDACADVLEGR